MDKLKAVKRSVTMPKSQSAQRSSGPRHTPSRRMSASGIARRRLLLSKARKLLSKKVLKDISMIDVAEAAKIPKGSAYFFYDSIDAIWSALVEQMYIELAEVMDARLSGPMISWAEMFSEIVGKALFFIESDPAASQLLVGPHIPAALKTSMRAEDVALGRVIDRALSTRFVLPQMPDRPKMFFLALEICDVLCTVSMIEYGKITEGYKAECLRASLAYLRTYLPENLPPTKPSQTMRK